MAKRHIKLFRYYKEWISVWKSQKIRDVTYVKYEQVQRWLKENAPDLYLDKLTRTDVQKIVNKYGETHELETVKDFLHHIQAPLRDAAYEGWVARDPTYKVVASSQVKHKSTRQMYLEVDEVQRLEKVLKKHYHPIADMCDFDLRTGLRFAEVLGLTPADVDFDKHTVYVNKTWNYKAGCDSDFMETKNKYSHRVITIDSQAEDDLRKNMFGVSKSEPIFVKRWTSWKMTHRTRPPRKSFKKYVAIHNATIDSYLSRLCKEAKVPRVTFHNLRHTHASLLIANGVSIQSVAKRLGHADTTTTQKTYIHLLDEMREKDNKQIVNIMNGLGGHGL